MLPVTAKTSASKDLKAVITAISTLVEEATFVANSDGITFRGMDPSHVALVDIVWPHAAFKEYKCEKEVKFGIRIDEMAKVVKRADKKDDMEIKIDDNQLLLAVGRGKKYTLRLIEPLASETPLPKIPYDTKISMPTAGFSRIVGDVHVVADYLTITAEGSKASFSGKGDAGEVVIDVDADNTVDVSTVNPGSGTYSLEYLSPIIKAIDAAIETITCEFSDAKPLRVEFPFAETGRIHFYLAPRVAAK